MLKAGKSRIYCVKETDSGKERLVNGPNPAQVRSYVTKGRFPVELADQRTIARLSKAGVEVEECKADDAP